MRNFSSYGPLSIDRNFYAPREALIERGLTRLVGEISTDGGHYITIWAPRQRQFDVAYIGLESLKMTTDVSEIINYITEKISVALQIELSATTLNEFEAIFSRDTLQKPLILMLDEFDVLSSLPLSVSAVSWGLVTRQDHLLTCSVVCKFPT